MTPRPADRIGVKRGLDPAMYELIQGLPAGSVVVDLGAGAGSFDYSATSARIVAADLAFPAQRQASADRLMTDSGRIALADRSADVVVCNHTLEHFEKLGEAVKEIDRILKPGGQLWVAVPDGYSFDDGLYRLLFRGGGHVNRFSLDSLIESLETTTRLRARRAKKLYSGFVYLNPPAPEKLPCYRWPARALAWIPARLLEHSIRSLIYLTRMIDRLLGSDLSQYGWGVVFRSEGDTRMPATPAGGVPMTQADPNVCFHCGSGHPEDALSPHLGRFLLFWKTYRCSRCGRRNLFVEG